MKIYALSDIHIDYPDNEKWLAQLSSQDFQDDLLILAGDISDKLSLLEWCFGSLSNKFRKVCFVPGNHELWVHNDNIASSFEKFQLVLELAQQYDISTDVFQDDDISIVPLFSWYDFSFGEPGNRIKEAWVDFRACIWPTDYTIKEVNRYFLDKNTDRLSHHNKTVISFSHFLPNLDVLPSYIPASQDYLHPVFGSTDLGKQVRTLQPHMHIYGHSHINNQVFIDDIKYINNAFGYPTETRISKKRLSCIYEG